MATDAYASSGQGVFSPSRKAGCGTGITDLPDELLLNIFTHLADIGHNYDDAGDSWVLSQLPFKTADKDDHPHPGLRAYPFLGQVCRKWKSLLGTAHAQNMLWSNMVLDFGHELVTAVHTPLKWSNQRPSPDDFNAALSATNLSVSKIMDFVRQRRHVITSVSLCNSEGFWGDDGEYLTLSNKHNFQASHLGYALGLLCDRLQELRLYNCNDLMTSDQGLWTAVATCSSLKSLVLEGVNCRIASSTASHLSGLHQLETLVITVERHVSAQWITGLDVLPPAWSQLTALKSLTLRRHQLLTTLPGYLATLPNLTHLDISSNANLDISNVTALTKLRTLSLQGLDLTQSPNPGEPLSSTAKRMLPDLTPLSASLTALSLAHNKFTRLPPCFAKLTGLRVLDLSGNKELAIPSPLTGLVTAMSQLAILDARGVHTECGNPSYWGPEKCTTMRHLSAAAKQLKRRKYTTRVLLDIQ